MDFLELFRASIGSSSGLLTLPGVAYSCTSTVGYFGHVGYEFDLYSTVSRSAEPLGRLRFSRNWEHQFFEKVETSKTAIIIRFYVFLKAYEWSQLAVPLPARLLQYRHVNFTQLRKLSQIAANQTTFEIGPHYDP